MKKKSAAAALQGQLFCVMDNMFGGRRLDERVQQRLDERIKQEREKAFQRGFEDAGRGVKRTRPPYGFTDLKEAWRKGWDRRSKRAAS